MLCALFASSAIISLTFVALIFMRALYCCCYWFSPPARRRLNADRLTRLLARARRRRSRKIISDFARSSLSLAQSPRKKHTTRRERPIIIPFGRCWHDLTCCSSSSTTHRSVHAEIFFGYCRSIYLPRARAVLAIISVILVLFFSQTRVYTYKRASIFVLFQLLQRGDPILHRPIYIDFDVFSLSLNPISVLREIYKHTRTYIETARRAEE